jgi:histidinol-phosphate aminotransferase
MIEPRKAIRQLNKYRPPLEGRGGRLRLDFNENTVGCAPQVVRALRRWLDPDRLSRYPEYEEARRKLAKYFGVATGEMLLANGTDDAINLICDIFVDPGDVLLVPAPTFPIYEFFHSVAGGRTVRVRYDENFRLPVDKLIGAAHSGVRWVALANPNNPTATTIPKPELRRILQKTPNTLVLVDEAYSDFAGETILPWIRKYKNLVVTRTFSKAFGLAALRLGCIFAHRDLAEYLRRGQNPFVVNSLAMAAAIEAIRHDAYRRRYVQEVLANRKRLCESLEALGVPYVPSSANFVLTRVGERAPEIAARLRRQKILIRDWSYDPHLKGYLRFTVGSASQTRKLIAGLYRQQHLMERRTGARAWADIVRHPSTGWFS